VRLAAGALLCATCVLASAPAHAASAQAQAQARERAARKACLVEVSDRDTCETLGWAS